MMILQEKWLKKTVFLPENRQKERPHAAKPSVASTAMSPATCHHSRFHAAAALHVIVQRGMTRGIKI
jgi:hypothetical protein